MRSRHDKAHIRPGLIEPSSVPRGTGDRWEDVPMTRTDSARPPMIWIGGAPGAGKSTWARTMAHAYDLPLHPIDLWTYDHAVRLPPAKPLDEDLARGPDAAAEALTEHSRTRLELVVQDIE